MCDLGVGTDGTTAKPGETMSIPQSIVIIGASLAGAKAAEALRNEGFDGRVTLVGEEPGRPYERPPLSKAYLRGEADFDGTAVHVADFYESNAIDLRTSTTVTAVDTHASEVELASGERVGYDRLLFTTGASPRRLKVPGSDLAGIHSLRSLADADAIRGAIARSAPVVVIGAGWIGSEVAASARQLGADVTVVDRSSVPLERALGKEVGGIYRDLHTKHGVKFRLGVGIESIRGATTVEEVRLTDGTGVPAGVVVAGIGVLPRTELAGGAGLEVDNGIITDEYLATTAPGIYAAGDVANAFHPGYRQRIRLEHWSSALNQGPVAAKNMLGKRAVYDKVPYFFSDQYDLGMEYRGWATGSDEVVFRGNCDREFVVFWLRHDRVVAAMNVNAWDQGEHIQALISDGGMVDRSQLVDTNIDLADLARRSILS
jgi:3-phenylpropionate/trans-cinnamate dioxygenase ferredoxin reductase component